MHPYKTFKIIPEIQYGNPEDKPFSKEAIKKAYAKAAKRIAEGNINLIPVDIYTELKSEHNP